MVGPFPLKSSLPENRNDSFMAFGESMDFKAPMYHCMMIFTGFYWFLPKLIGRVHRLAPCEL